MSILRRLPLRHACNVRDLGGYPIGDSRMTAWNRCYRSDHLHDLDETDWQTLKDAKVTLILDLRSTQERSVSPYECESYGIKQLHLPFMKADVGSVAHQDAQSQKEFLKSMRLDYVEILRQAESNLVEALEAIQNTLSLGEAVLFHCTAGKDRTGILACILLDLCGVGETDILADYEVSATYNLPGVNQMLPKEMMAIPQVRALFESHPDMLKPLLDYLHEKGTEAYVRSLGVSQDCIDTLRRELVIEQR